MIYPMEELYQPLLRFLAFDLEEPIAKLHLENGFKNETHDIHATADYLISALIQFIQKRTDGKLRNASDVAVFK